MNRPAAGGHGREGLEVVLSHAGDKASCGTLGEGYGMADGAQNALAGYLYQFVGAAGLAARAKNPDDAQHRRSAGFFARLRESSVVHELADMDAAVLLNDTDAVGVQYKYSHASPPRAIDRQELIEILDAFHRSAKRAPEIHFVEFVLISNRPLEEAASDLYSTRGRTTPDPTLSPDPGRGGMLSKVAKKAQAYYGNKHLAASNRHDVLNLLILHPICDHEDSTKEVRNYASRYGTLPSEFEDALSHLMGRILRRTIGAPLELTAELLNASLIGVPDARPLGPAGAAGNAREIARSSCLDYIEKLTHDASILVRRRFLDDLDRAVGQYALVFIVGEGGSGKSVLAAQYLREMAGDRYVAAISAADVDGNWPGAEFRRWRSPNHFGDLKVESFDGMLSRIRQAERHVSRPILLLDLDGIDEIQHRQAAKQLIGEFLRRGGDEPSDAVLLVTCRSEGTDVERTMRKIISTWLSTEVPYKCAELVGQVVVGDFDEEELLRAANSLGGTYRNRLSGSFRDPSPDLPVELLYAEDERFASGVRSGLRRDIARSFLHPAMWQAFLEVGEDHRLKVLDEEPKALGLLADAFLSRFCRKAELRRPASSGERLMRALKRIGANVPGDRSVFDRVKDWIDAARGPVGDDEAYQLFEEAKSYGLIVETDHDRWSWRHAIVYDRLRED